MTGLTPNTSRDDRRQPIPQASKSVGGGRSTFFEVARDRFLDRSTQLPQEVARAIIERMRTLPGTFQAKWGDQEILRLIGIIAPVPFTPGTPQFNKVFGAHFPSLYNVIIQRARQETCVEDSTFDKCSPTSSVLAVPPRPNLTHLAIDLPPIRISARVRPELPHLTARDIGIPLSSIPLPSDILGIVTRELRVTSFIELLNTPFHHVAQLSSPSHTQGELLSAICASLEQLHYGLKILFYPVECLPLDDEQKFGLKMNAVPRMDLTTSRHLNIQKVILTPSATETLPIDNGFRMAIASPGILKQTPKSEEVAKLIRSFALYGISKVLLAKVRM